MANVGTMSKANDPLQTGSNGFTTPVKGKPGIETKDDGIISNPGAELDKDAFMKLLLVELEHQDPTSPMDSEKMLTQTAQLSALEMQDNTNKTMTKLVGAMGQLQESISASLGMSALSAVGKLATVKDNYLQVGDNDAQFQINMYLPREVEKDTPVTFTIRNERGDTVRTLTAKGMTAGPKTIGWDRKNDDGNIVPNGKYYVSASYTDSSGQAVHSTYGAYPIEGIKFDNNQVLVSMGGQWVKFSAISEITG